MYSKELELAVKLAECAHTSVLSYFRNPLDVDTKSDESPVTIADRETERMMRELIGETFPDHGILGEEFGAERTDAPYVWALDPIDGTKSFITGNPLFGTLISLLKDGHPIIGIIDMPALGERWIGCTGQQTTFNGKDVHVRPCAKLSDAWLYATSPHMFGEDGFPAFERVRKLSGCVLYGIDCYSYGLLANGSCDLVVEATMGTYDYCALVPVITGAGGIMTDWQGQPLDMKSDGRVIAAGDQGIADKVRDLLNQNE
ncbi:MAG: histidinol-phosphatase [Rhodospirillaceae bacterium]|nr:histidinol-phosphatase [Rhodospirillaceae bacterium]